MKPINESPRDKADIKVQRKEVKKERWVIGNILLWATTMLVCTAIMLWVKICDSEYVFVVFILCLNVTTYLHYLILFKFSLKMLCNATHMYYLAKNLDGEQELIAADHERRLKRRKYCIRGYKVFYGALLVTLGILNYVEARKNDFPDFTDYANVTTP